MNNPNKKRLRRTMMFLNAQKPGLIKDPYIYKADSLMLDLEDAVAENQKDVARFSLYHALKTVDYRGAERVVDGQERFRAMQQMIRFAHRFGQDVRDRAGQADGHGVS